MLLFYGGRLSYIRICINVVICNRCIQISGGSTFSSVDSTFQPFLALLSLQFSLLSVFLEHTAILEDLTLCASPLLDHFGDKIEFVLRIVIGGDDALDSDLKLPALLQGEILYDFLNQKRFET